MRISAVLSVLLAGMTVLGPAAYAQQKEMIIANAPYPPFVTGSEGAAPGIDMEIASTVLERMGIKTSVQIHPFPRVLAMLKSGEADMTTTLSFNEERDAYLEWSIPYRTGSGYRIFSLKESGFRPESLADLRGKTIGVVRGFSYPESFSGNRDILKLEAGDSGLLVRMFLAGRFDAMISNSIVGLYELKTTGRLQEVVQAPFLIRSEDNRATVMGFSRQSVSAETVDRFNLVLAEMIRDGTVDRIEKKYLQ